MLALITGTTSGIGKASAEIFARNGWNLILTGRRKDRLEPIASDLQKKYKIKTLILNFDVRNLKEVVKNIDSIKGEWKNIDLLLNNAGLASGLSTIQDGNIEDWEIMIDTNIKGLLYMTRQIAPLLIAKNKGHIIIHKEIN